MNKLTTIAQVFFLSWNWNCPCILWYAWFGVSGRASGTCKK